MALENKMSWNALAYLLKDITTYDPKTVVVALLNTLEKLHLKMVEKDVEDLLPNADYKEHEDEGINMEASIDYMEENQIVEDHVDVTSSIEDNNHIYEDKIETMVNENDIEVLEVVKETFDTENPFDSKNIKGNSEVKYDDKHLIENEEYEVRNDNGHEVDYK